MSRRWVKDESGYRPVVVKWETQSAQFLQIEVSPLHVFRIKIDKDIPKKGGLGK
ncbi:hypothetical protein ACFL0T_01180 [Candidatus Omnitrophota bacterium]